MSDGDESALSSAPVDREGIGHLLCDEAVVRDVRCEHRIDVKIGIKRVYDNPGTEDSYRVLVDRVWPRGRSKAQVAVDEWARDVAPSTGLRSWFGHDPKRWPAFQQRYQAELQSPEQQARLRALLSAAGRKPIMLVYSARDEEHNQAVVLREVLSRMSRKH